MTVWELFSLKDKVAIVTGGARNLGYDMATALAEAGAAVAVLAVQGGIPPGEVDIKRMQEILLSQGALLG